jgi:hypothetical protein
MPDDLDAGQPAGGSRPTKVDRYKISLASLAETLSRHL